MTLEDGARTELQLWLVLYSVTYRLVRLRRDDSVASEGRALEGVFTCNFPGDTNTPVSVGIYYPSELHVQCHLLI